MTSTDSTTWEPTHHLPPTGVTAWDAPSPTGRWLGRLTVDAVRADEEREPWTRVVTAEGTAVWVDGRLLERIGAMPAAAAAPRRTPREATNWLSVVGAAVVLIGAAMPWVGFIGSWANGFAIPLVYVLTYRRAAESLSAGILACATLVVLLPLLTRRPLPRAVVVVLGALVINVAIAAAVLDLRATPGMESGPGIAVTACGGLTLLVAARPHWATRRTVPAGYVGWTPGNRFALLALAVSTLPVAAALLLATATGGSVRNAEYAFPGLRDDAAAACATGSTAFCPNSGLPPWTVQL